MIYTTPGPMLRKCGYNTVWYLSIRVIRLEYHSIHSVVKIIHRHEQLSTKGLRQTKVNMSVLVETSAGELVIDLHCDDCPLTTKNFLKLCKMKYYNGCLIYNVQQNFIIQTGDPSGTGEEGTSAYGLMYGEQARAFEGEIRKHLKHNKIGVVSMAGDSSEGAAPGNRSQFFITLRGEDMEHLDGKHTVFGEIAEGFDVLAKLNELYVDENGRPFQDVRIKHTFILDDPFDDPPQLDIPPNSPDIEYPKEEKVNRRIPYEDGIVEAEEEGRTTAELEESIRRKEAESRAIVLEMTGDIPDAEVLMLGRLHVSQRPLPPD